LKKSVLYAKQRDSNWKAVNYVLSLNFRAIKVETAD